MIVDDEVVGRLGRQECRLIICAVEGGGGGCKEKKRKLAGNRAKRCKSRVAVATMVLAEARKSGCEMATHDEARQAELTGRGVGLHLSILSRH